MIYVAWAETELTIYLRMGSWSSCLYFQSAGIPRVHYHTWLGNGFLNGTFVCLLAFSFCLLVLIRKNKWSGIESILQSGFPWSLDKDKVWQEMHLRLSLSKSHPGPEAHLLANAASFLSSAFVLISSFGHTVQLTPTRELLQPTAFWSLAISTAPDKPKSLPVAPYTGVMSWSGAGRKTHQVPRSYLRAAPQPIPLPVICCSTPKISPLGILK